MRKKNIIPFLLILAGLFVGLNIFLLTYHEESIYNRKVYVGEWSTIPTHDLRDVTAEEGIYKAKEEATVFLDSSLGTYMRTLVKEKTEVEENEPLIEYQLHDFEEIQRELQTQLDEISTQISAVETTLAQLEAVQIHEENPVSPSLGEEGNLQEEPDSPPLEEEAGETDSTAYLQEQFRLEKQEELVSLRAREERLQEELNQVTEDPTHYIPSPVSGTVKKIENQDGHPVITISSRDLIIEGSLTEKDRKRIKNRMKVNIAGISSPGRISELSDFPETNSDMESTYRFQVSLENNEAIEEEILPGYHTVIEIIRSERLDVPAVHEDHLTDTLIPAVWILTEDGSVAYRQLETGIRAGRWTEIVNGAEAGEPVAESRGNLTNGAIFVTPLDTRFMDWSRFNKEGTSLIQRDSLLAGLFHR